MGEAKAMQVKSTTQGIHCQACSSKATFEKERDALGGAGGGSPSSSSQRPSAPLRASSAKDLRRCVSISSTMSPIALLSHAQLCACVFVCVCACARVCVQP